MARRVGRSPGFLIVILGLLLAGSCSSRLGLIRSSTVDRTVVDAAVEVRPTADAVVTCAGLPSGAPAPAGACPDATPARCGFDGTCDGAGGCHRYAAGTVCAAPTCLDSATFQPSSVCDGQGTCVAGPPLTCSPYTCLNGACDVDDCQFHPTDCVATPHRDASPG